MYTYKYMCIITYIINVILYIYDIYAYLSICVYVFVYIYMSDSCAAVEKTTPDELLAPATGQLS